MSVILSDVDGVLNVDGEPVPWIGFLFDALRLEHGHDLVLWSARGHDYAKTWGSKLHLWPFDAYPKAPGSFDLIQKNHGWVAIQIDDSPGQRISNDIPFLHATWRA